MLSHVPLLSHLSEDEREAILDECTHREYQPGEVIAIDCNGLLWIASEFL